jgi:hypothetical protein
MHRFNGLYQYESYHFSYKRHEVDNVIGFSFFNLTEVFQLAGSEHVIEIFGLIQEVSQSVSVFLTQVVALKLDYLVAIVCS